MTCITSSGQRERPGVPETGVGHGEGGADRTKLTVIALARLFLNQVCLTRCCVTTLRTIILIFAACIAGGSAFAQGGPPFYTNDPGTPGANNWEINVGYIPFFYTDQSVSHTPDLDLNYGVGDRIQLTYENAWLRVHDPAEPPKYGLGQSNFGVKWRFYDAGEQGWSIATFPQGFVNNPNNSVSRGITPKSQAFLLPFEFARKLGPVDLNFELGYNFVHNGPSGWLTGLIAGHTFNPRFEIDAEYYNISTYNPYQSQPTIDVGGRYRIHNPIVLLLMAGRGLEHAGPTQPYFVGYFGVQFLLPSRAYNADIPQQEPKREP